MPIQDTDNLIVGRGSDTYKIEYGQVKSNLADDYVKIDDGGTKQVIKSAGLGISDGTDENITLNADGTAIFANNTHKIGDKKVGIGTITPSAILDVNGAQQDMLTLRTTSGSSCKLNMADANTTSNTYLQALGDDFRAVVNGAPRVHIKDSGNVGIGTDAPGSHLDVRGGNGRWAFNTQANLNGEVDPPTDAGFSIGWNRSQGQGETNICVGTGVGANPGFSFDTWDGTTYTPNSMFIRHNGNVGIATITPSEKLEVNGKIRATSFDLESLSPLQP